MPWVTTEVYFFGTTRVRNIVGFDFTHSEARWCRRGYPVPPADNKTPDRSNTQLHEALMIYFEVIQVDTTDW